MAPNKLEMCRALNIYSFRRGLPAAVPAPPRGLICALHCRHRFRHRQSM